MNFFDRFKSKFAQAPEKTAVKSTVASDSKTATQKTETPTVTSDTHTELKKGLFGDVLVHPLVTEKTAVLAGLGKYVFVVSAEATKIGVKKAVQALYGTMPESVAMINRAGKRVRFGRYLGQRKDWKKAIVTMPEGKTLPIYE